MGLGFLRTGSDLFACVLISEPLGESNFWLTALFQLAKKQSIGITSLGFSVKI
jgi:hypothetical protein